MTTTREIPRVGDPAGIAQPDLDAQIHCLSPRIAHVALELGLGRPHPTRHGFLFSRDDERRALEEIEARRLQRRRRKPDPQTVVVYEAPDLLRGLREVEIELIELQLKVRTLTAIVMAGGS